MRTSKLYGETLITWSWSFVSRHLIKYINTISNVIFYVLIKTKIKFSDLIRRMNQHINIIIHSILLFPTLSLGNAAQSTTEMLTVVEV